MVCVRLTVLTWANRKGTLVQNFVLRKGLPVHGGEFPRSPPQCFFREQQNILADILCSNQAKPKKRDLPFLTQGSREMLILSSDGHLSVLRKWVDTRHGLEYERARKLLRLEKTLREHLLQPPAQRKVNTEFRPGF